MGIWTCNLCEGSEWVYSGMSPPYRAVPCPACRDKKKEEKECPRCPPGCCNFATILNGLYYCPWEVERKKKMNQLTCNCEDICCSPLSPECKAKNKSKCFPPLNEQEKKMSKCNCGPLEVCTNCPYQSGERACIPTVQFHTRLQVQGKFKPHVRKALAQSQTYLPTDIAKLYGWPTGLNGSPVTIYIPEFGGGYDPSAINSYFTNTLKLPPPNLTAVSILGATNQYSNNPNDASVEVVLDVCAAGGIYSYMTGQAAKIVVVFAPNSDAGFLDATQYIAKQGNGVCTFSWGGPEDNWSNATIQQMDAAFLTGLNNGITWLAAAGDNGSSDGESGNHVDYPSSSPYVLACGGTALHSNNGLITSETVWNDGSQGGATGGGISAVEPKPSYQASISAANRAIPDWTGNADPVTGWSIATFGVIGGTSAVAPMYAGFLAAACTAKGKALGSIHSALYANPTAFRDVTVGNNGAYNASVGYDETSGLGVATTSLFALLVGITSPPVNPNPPPVVPPPVTTPTEPTLQEIVAQINSTCVQTEKQVARIFARFTEYLRVKIESDLQTLYAKKGNWFKE